jgi:hypothetical protein
MASELSVASTVLPTDSASQAPDKPKPNARGGRRGGGNTRSPKTDIDKAAPPGPVEVQPGGQNKTGKKTQVLSATIPISGWGETDLSSFRKDIRPEFTADASPYVDLVNVVYENIQSRFSGQGKHIPYGLFVYYCMLMWWYRVLYLHKANANTLTQEEKQAYNVLSSGEEFMVPSPIAQYLANLGNFQQGGETFYFRKLKTDFGGEWDSGIVKKGWLSVDGGIQVTDSQSFWTYAQVPVPGVYTLYAVNEAASTRPQAPARQELDHVAPVVADQIVKATNNIVGWNIVDYEAHHSSWRSTYTALGWSSTQLPADVQTNFNISNSTLKWVSERLSTVNGLKLHSSKQFSLSVQGNPLIAAYLGTQSAPDVPLWWQTPAELDTRRGSGHLALGLNSRYSMDPKFLSPTFSFGYRLNRQRTFSAYKNGVAVYYAESPYDPWIFFSSKTQKRVSPPQNWWNSINQTFTLGSQSYINIERFSTHALNRWTGLEAAVILSPAS